MDTVRIDDLVQSCGDSMFAPGSLDDIRRRLAFIESSECECDTTPHENAIHDLVHDDVPVLLRVIEKLLG